MEVTGLSENSGEKTELMHARITEHIAAWKHVKFEDIKFQRMAGLSNACYKVTSGELDPLLYRKFECKIVDKNVEALIFEIASEQGIGPKLLHAGEGFRIEHFLIARPLSIWEMRNPVLRDVLVDKLFDFNFNETLAQEVEKVLPMSELAIEKVINKWCPAVKERLPSMRGKLLQDNGIPHPDLLRAIDRVDSCFLFNGYQEYFNSLIPRDSPMVLAHNDSQENNILAHLEDNKKITLIDFEYAGWQPMAYDLANYLNECILDNAHPGGIGICMYPENTPSDEERTAMLSRYLNRYYHEVLLKQGAHPQTWEEYEKERLPIFEHELKRCQLLGHLLWAVWSLHTLEDTDVTNESVFNYQYAEMHVKAFRQKRQQWKM